MSTYTKIKFLSRCLIGLAVLCVVSSAIIFAVSNNRIGADTTTHCPVTNFKQTDQKWGGNPYGKDEYGNKAYIANAGCGPTAAAIVLRAHGWDVTPAIIADYCLRNGYRIDGSGTSVRCFSELASDRKLNITRLTDYDEVQKWLSAGFLAIVLVGPGTNSKYTSGGHYIVIYNLVNGNVNVSDPNSNVDFDSFSSIYHNYYQDGFWFFHSKSS